MTIKSVPQNIFKVILQTEEENKHNHENMGNNKSQ
jgi:hypothetical protein